MVDARIHGAIVSKANDALSYVFSLEKFTLAEYVDSQELDRDIESNLGTAVFNVLVKIKNDEALIDRNVIPLKNAISDWLGDLQSEIKFAGPDGSREILEYFKKITEVNRDLESKHDIVRKDILELYTLLDTSLTNLHGDSKKTNLITSLAKVIVNTTKQLVADADEVKKLIEDLDKYIHVFNAQSPELRNYQNAEKKFDDLLEGKGVYAVHTLKQRYDILARVLRTKSIIKLPDGTKINSDMLSDVESMRKIKTFMKEYETENQLAMSLLTIENPKYNEWMTYQDSLKRLMDKGFKRHLRPIEFYEILLEHFRTNGLGTHEDVVKNINFGRGEWFSAAFRKKGDTLEISWDPENIAWNEAQSKYITNGDLRVDASFNIGEKVAKGSYRITEFPPELVHTLYGAEVGELLKYNARICLPPEGVWWPIGCGYGLGASRFDILSDYDGRASRGIK